MELDYGARACVYNTQAQRLKRCRDRDTSLCLVARVIDDLRSGYTSLPTEHEYTFTADEARRRRRCHRHTQAYKLYAPLSSSFAD